MNKDNVMFSPSPPPEKLYKEIVKKFGDRFALGCIYTVGDTIHTKNTLPEHLIRHELTHVKQQKEYPGGPEEWWKRYLKDTKFVISQESAAYQRQYRWIKANIKDRNEASQIIHGMARDFSGAMYGDLMSYSEALGLIQK